jgi:putative spermidine/putrescine transport system substrate-binding protein
MNNWGIVGPMAGQHQVDGGIARRRLLKLAIAGSATVLGAAPLPYVVTPAKGAEKIIKIGMWSGPRAELIKSTLIKRLEEEYRVKFFVDEGWTTEQLARLRASKNNPAHTVLLLDDVAISIARQEGLIEKLPGDKIPT